MLKQKTMVRTFFLTGLLISVQLFSFAQNKLLTRNENSAKYKIVWEKPISVKLFESSSDKFLSFEGAQYSFEDGYLPRYNQKISIVAGQSFSAKIINPFYQEISNEELLLITNKDKIQSQIIVNSQLLISKKQPYGVVSFVPIRRNELSGKYEKLVSFDLDIIPTLAQKSVTSTRNYADHSVLQNGNWYKIAVATNGVCKISYSFLQNMGIDVATINPKNIRIYGNGGGMLPELNSVVRQDDLVENAIVVQGENDGVFNTNDYILFYAKGPNTWTYNSATCPNFQHNLNIYSDSSYYFITADLGIGKRVQTQASSTLAITNTTSTFDDYAFHEIETTNFIKSGRQWFGEYFENTSSYNFAFSFPNIDLSATTNVKARIASRYISNSGSASYSISSQSGSATLSIPFTTTDESNDYAKISSTCYSFNPSNSVITVNVTKQNPSAIAWLDYIEVNTRRQLTMFGNQMGFRDSKTVGSGNVTQYDLLSYQPIQIWDITNPSTVVAQEFTNPSVNNYQFVLPSDTLHEFMAFTSSSFISPVFSNRVENQDLHALSNKNFIIVTHPDFYDQALQLSRHHETRDSLTTIIVTPQQIYNEFSSGAQDVSAIRDFVKMFYDKATTVSEEPQYLLLFGDGSYDNKKRFASNTNFIPTYESYNSTVITASYVSDDFYGLLDDNEGQWVNDAVDIGIGRFPVKSSLEASAVINKIFDYTKTGILPNTTNNSSSNQSSNSPFGDWRNTICFVADDEDGDLHISDANKLATQVDTTDNDYNIDKIYFDAYVQESTPGGQRYPNVTDAINKRVDKGCLIFNYTGHGGEVGLAHERVVEVSNINSWSNINNLPLFITATCEFSRFDDPERTSAGEYVLLNPNGGGIGLFTTVRPTYASGNYVLNRDFYEAAFTPINGKMPRLGDLFNYIKNQSGGNSVNSRNFTLLGDPALTLAYPKYDVSTDSINAMLVTSSSLDTLKALTLVTVSGNVRNSSGTILNNYNGVLSPTVYDKAQNITTLSNDGSFSPPFAFKLQKNILYKGKVSVTNGKFKFSFIVPKDIAYQYGIGRISYYAENGTEDANGSYEKIIIGGSNNNAPKDFVGPEIGLYMNDNKFVFGGMTNENPVLFSTLKDENGINTVGNGIGHDLTAVLDANTENSIVLNDYYQSDLNSYKSGTVRYPFSSLSEGKHSLKLKVWDVYNNSSESYTEFVVAKSAELALSHVLNYPNPFTTKTQFYFEQNQCCTSLEVEVQVFTITGKLVKTIAMFAQTEGFRSEPIEWDGRDDFGDKIGRGVYVYRVRVKTTEGKTAEKYEKLVILN